MPGYDNLWFSRIQKFGLFQAYDFLTGYRKFRLQQKQLFLKNKIKNPTLDYPFLDFRKISKYQTGLLSLKKDIKKLEKNSDIKKIYLSKIEEKLLAINLLRAVKEKNMASFLEFTQKTCGAPKKQIYNYIIKKKFKQAGKRAIKEPSLNTQILAKKKIGSFFKTLLQVVYFKKKYQSQDIKDIFEKCLQQLGINDWSVIIDKSSRTEISVNQENKIIDVPVDRLLDYEETRKVVIHEIGTHVLRRVNGEKSNFRLLGAGLGFTGRAEEGIATFSEQAISRFYEYARLDRYYAICLVYGFDGKKTDFHQTFKRMVDYYLLENLSLDQAQEMAWNTCVRTFRGTDCQTPGVCFTKDLVYTEGNILIWQLFARHPKILKRFYLGKYDPINKDHNQLLKKLEIF